MARRSGETIGLCAAADRGQILASDIVRALAGAGCGLELRPVPPPDLKGLPGPSRSVFRKVLATARELGLANIERGAVALQVSR